MYNHFSCPLGNAHKRFVGGRGLRYRLTLSRSRWKPMPSRLIEILLVEDSPGDVRLAKETLKEYKMQNTLHVVEDGEQALQFLRKEGRYAGAVTPDLVLLDLKLPKIDGVEVLGEMQKMPLFNHIPVVVLAASQHD